MQKPMLKVLFAALCLSALAVHAAEEESSEPESAECLVDWEQDGSDRFTVPVGFGINKTINFGKVPIRFGREAMYSVVRPNNRPGSKWNFRIYLIPAVPSALFGWMQ